MLLQVQLLSAHSELPVLSARVSANGTAADWPLRIGGTLQFDISKADPHCVLHLEFFCSKSSGLVLPLGTTVVDLAREDLSQTPSRKIWGWDGGDGTRALGRCCVRIACAGSWTPLPDLTGLGFDKVLSGQLASTWARFGGAYSPIVSGIGLDNIHSPYYQQRVRVHGHASPLLPIRYWLESGTAPAWSDATLRACLRYYENACVVASRRRPRAGLREIAADVLMFPCRFVRYREDRSPLNNELQDTYQEPYIPGHDALADCEDFSKIVQLSYVYLLAAAAAPRALSARLSEVVSWLQLREVVIVQGAAKVSGHAKLCNHVWAVLMEKRMLRYVLSPLGTPAPSTVTESLILEGTSMGLGSNKDCWTPTSDVEAFYAYTMALHVAPNSAFGGDYELVRRGPRGVYAMPSSLFFQQDWGNWRALKVNSTSKQQDKRVEDWMRVVEIPRRLPAAARLIHTKEVPLARTATPSRTDGVSVSTEWKLNFH